MRSRISASAGQNPHRGCSPAVTRRMLLCSGVFGAPPDQGGRVQCGGKPLFIIFHPAQKRKGDTGDPAPPAALLSACQPSA